MLGLGFFSLEFYSEILACQTIKFVTTSKAPLLKIVILKIFLNLTYGTTYNKYCISGYDPYYPFFIFAPRIRQPRNPKPDIHMFAMWVEAFAYISLSFLLRSAVCTIQCRDLEWIYVWHLITSVMT